MTMTKKEVFDIMGSDMKLWDTADTKPSADGKGLVKTLDLPFGIGPYSVTLEGMTDAQKKREAVGSYAAHIRGLIKERIDDQTVEARAKASAARREQADSTNSVRGGSEGVSGEGPQETSNAGAGETHQASAGGAFGSREDFIAQRSALTKTAEDLNDRLTEVKKKLRFVDTVLQQLYMMEEDNGESTGTDEVVSEGD